jgi:RNase P subunit RPR2
MERYIVFGLETCDIGLPRDENGMYSINIKERCTNFFLLALDLAYTRLSHQGNPSLIKRDLEEYLQQEVANMSRKTVTVILHVAKRYGIRGAYEEMKRLICNDTYLRLCPRKRNGRTIQQYFVPRTLPSAKIEVERRTGFQHFLSGLSACEKEIYSLSVELELQSREKKAVTRSQTSGRASCEEITV